MAWGCFRNDLKMKGLGVQDYWRYTEFRDIDIAAF